MVMVATPNHGTLGIIKYLELHGLFPRSVFKVVKNAKSFIKYHSLDTADAQWKLLYSWPINGNTNDPGIVPTYAAASCLLDKVDPDDPATHIVAVVPCLIPLKPGQTTVPKDPKDANFAIPD